MPVQEQPLPERHWHPRADRPGDQQARGEVLPDRGPLHDEYMRHRGDPIRRSESVREAALRLDGHVHRGVALHGSGEAPVSLLGRLSQEPLAQHDPEHQRDEHDHDRAADELGESELPAQQKEHDDAKLKDKVGRGDLERHGRSEVRTLAKQRTRKRHCCIGARRGSHPEPGCSHDGPGPIIAQEPNHGGASHHRLDDGRESEPEDECPQDLPGHRPRQ